MRKRSTTGTKPPDGGGIERLNNFFAPLRSFTLTWRRTGALALTAIMLISMVGGPAAAAVGQGLNFGDDVDDTNTATWFYYVDNDFSKAQHPMDQGTSHQAMAGITDDQGDWISGADSIFMVNRTSNVESGDNVNPYTLIPGHIAEESFLAFPDKSGRTIGNASRWTVNSGSGNVTISNTSVNADADAVEISTGSNGDSGSGQVVVTEVKFNAWDGELDTDETRRYIILGGNVTTLESNTVIEFRVYDESGSYVELVANQSRNFNNNADVFANQTGAFFKQVKINQLTVQGADSTFDNIENVTVRVNRKSGSTGDAEVRFSAIDLRQKSRLDLGEQKATTDNNGDDSDSDGEYDETQDVYNVSGSYSIHDVSTMDEEFNDATLNDVSYPIHYDIDNEELATEGNDEDYLIEWESAEDYPDYEYLLNFSVRLELINYIDAQYGNNIELRMVQGWPEGRYETLGVHTGASGSNLTAVSMTDKKGNLSSKEDEITLLTGVSSGTEHVAQVEMLLTRDNRATVDPSFSTASPTPGAAVAVGDGSGPVNAVLSVVVGGLVALGVFFRNQLMFWR